MALCYKPKKKSSENVVIILNHSPATSKLNSPSFRFSLMHLDKLFTYTAQMTPRKYCYTPCHHVHQKLKSNENPYEFFGKISGKYMDGFLSCHIRLNK